MLVTYITPETGGYEQLNGSLLVAHPVVNKVNRLLSQRMGQDVRNPTYGNPLITTKNLSVNDITSGVNYCLEPLTSTGEISNLEVIEKRKSVRGRWSVQLLIEIPSSIDPIPITWAQPKDLIYV